MCFVNLVVNKVGLEAKHITIYLFYAPAPSLSQTHNIQLIDKCILNFITCTRNRSRDLE